MRTAQIGLLVVVFGLVLPAVFLEGAFRIFAPTYPGIYQSDSMTLFGLVPGGRATFVHSRVNGGQRVSFHINAGGFRGPELRPSATGTRIAVYGDSFIEGEFSPEPETYVRQLEATLQSQRTDSVEVVNAGAHGFGPDQEFARMRREIELLRPALIVWAIFADNDLSALVRNRMYRLTADSNLAPTHAVLSAGIREYLDKRAHPRGLRMLHVVRWLDAKLEQKNSSFGQGMGILRPGEQWPTISQYIAWSFDRSNREYRDFVADPNDTVRTIFGDHYDADVAATPDEPSSRYKLAAMDKLFALARDTLAARGVRVLVLVIPSPIDACASYDIRVDSLQFPRYDRRRISGEFETMARRQQLPVLNLWAPFSAAGACALYFRDGNTHWNAAGQALAARVTADTLRGLGWIR